MLSRISTATRLLSTQSGCRLTRILLGHHCTNKVEPTSLCISAGAASYFADEFKFVVDGLSVNALPRISYCEKCLEKCGMRTCYSFRSEPAICTSHWLRRWALQSQHHAQMDDRFHSLFTGQLAPDHPMIASILWLNAPWESSHCSSPARLQAYSLLATQ